MAEAVDLEERLLVLAPTGRDAPLTCSLLERAGLHARACRDVAELCREVERGAAGVLLAEEALTPSATRSLTTLLERQPPWSDLPILLFVAHWESPRGRPPNAQGTLALFTRLGNVTVLDRPLRPITMVTAARSALRARRRQYGSRAELERQAEEVRERDQFLAMLGHELRNPLGAMMLAIEMLDRTGDVATHTPVIRRQGRHLTRLVDDLLEVARVTRGKVALRREVLDLGQVLARAVSGVAGRSGAHRLHLDPLPAELRVEGDPVRLEQVFGNLLTNAIKYTPAGGGIAVGVDVEGSEAVVRVRDEGVGIDAEDLPRIFDLFAQVGDNLQRSDGGLGIGLTLVRALVDLHGGTITARSAGKGRGSTFTVRLPLHRGAAEAAPEPAAPTAREGEALRVLVVEDLSEARELLCALIEVFGHRPEAAADGETAVERALGDPPDVALVDIGLPRLDGYAVARNIRAALGSEVLLVAITGYGQTVDRERAMEAGFDLHWTKPIEPDLLERLLAKRARREGALREGAER